MSVTLKSEFDPADTSNTSMLVPTGLFFTVRNGYMLPSTVWTDALDASVFRSCQPTLTEVGPETVCSAICYKSGQEAVDLLGHRTSSCNECQLCRCLQQKLILWAGGKVVEVPPIRLWRNMACQLWDQRQRTMCKTWHHLISPMEWAPRHTASTSTSKKSRWETPSTGCPEEHQRNVSFQPLLGSYWPRWCGAHWMWREYSAVYHICS